VIASAFPGLFTFAEFQAMDLRALIAWSKLAELTSAARRVEAATIARAAMATDESFAAWIAEQRFRIAELRMGPEEATAASFAAFGQFLDGRARN
jgi:hypothetical protein